MKVTIEQDDTEVSIKLPEDVLDWPSLPKLSELLRFLCSGLGYSQNSVDKILPPM